MTDDVPLWCWWFLINEKIKISPLRLLHQLVLQGNGLHARELGKTKKFSFSENVLLLESTSKDHEPSSNKARLESHTSPTGCWRNSESRMLWGRTGAYLHFPPPSVCVCIASLSFHQGPQCADARVVWNKKLRCILLIILKRHRLIFMLNNTWLHWVQQCDECFWMK